jgi:hypothetical protein
MGEWIFLTSALVGGDWSPSRPSRFTPGERTPGTNWIGGWVGPRAGLDDVEKRKLLTLPGLEIRTLGCPARNQSLYRLRYPDSWATHVYNIIFSLLSLFKRMKVGLCDLHSVCISPLINFWTPGPIFMKLRTFIMASEPVSTANFLNPSHQSVCLYVYPPLLARQRLGKNVTVTMNTYATIEELLDVSFSMRSVSYQGK